MARITIHIPCHDYGRFLGDAIESVLAQTCGDWEAIVTDDASTDETPEVLAAYRDPRIRVIRHAENQGNIATYNEAIAAADAEFFVILSADDRYRPRFVERTLDMFARYPSAGVVYTRWQRIDDAGLPLPEGPTMPHRADGLYDEIPTLLERSYIAGCSAVARLATLRALGGYDARMPFTADTFLWRQIATMAPFGYVHEPLYEYRRHDSEMTFTRDRAAVLETEHRMHLDLILSDPLTPARVAVRKNHFYAELYWTIARWYATSGRPGLAARRLARALALDPLVWKTHGAIGRTRRRLVHPGAERPLTTRHEEAA